MYSINYCSTCACNIYSIPTFQLRVQCKKRGTFNEIFMFYSPLFSYQRPLFCRTEEIFLAENETTTNVLHFFQLFVDMVTLFEEAVQSTFSS